MQIYIISQPPFPSTARRNLNIRTKMHVIHIELKDSSFFTGLKTCLGGWERDQAAINQLWESHIKHFCVRDALRGSCECSKHRMGGFKPRITIFSLICPFIFNANNYKYGVPQGTDLGQQKLFKHL